MLSVPVIATLVSISLWIVSGVISKKAATGLGRTLAPLIVSAVGLIPMAIATVIVGQYTMPLNDIIISLFAGILGGLGFLSIYLALMTEQLSNSVAFGEIQPPIFVLFGILVLGEQLSLVQTICIIAIFIGTLLILTTEKLTINKKLIPALISPILWAIYWILMSYATTDAKTFPLPVTVSRIAVAAVIFAYFLYDKKNQPAKSTSTKKSSISKKLLYLIIALAVLSGLMDGAGDTLFSFVVGASAIAIGGALVALQPVVISFFSFILYKEKLTSVQLLGLLVMVVAAIALALL